MRHVQYSNTVECCAHSSPSMCRRGSAKPPWIGVNGRVLHPDAIGHGKVKSRCGPANKGVSSAMCLYIRSPIRHRPLSAQPLSRPRAETQPAARTATRPLSPCAGLGTRSGSSRGPRGTGGRSRTGRRSRRLARSRAIGRTVVSSSSRARAMRRLLLVLRRRPLPVARRNSAAKCDGLRPGQCGPARRRRPARPKCARRYSLGLPDRLVAAARRPDSWSAATAPAGPRPHRRPR